MIHSSDLAISVSDILFIPTVPSPRDSPVLFGLLVLFAIIEVRIPSNNPVV
jgi:hypothetical protein